MTIDKEKIDRMKHLSGSDTISIEGQEFTKDELAEIFNGTMRQADYTKKTQELAEKRKELEEQQAQLEQELTRDLVGDTFDQQPADKERTDKIEQLENEISALKGQLSQGSPVNQPSGGQEPDFLNDDFDDIFGESGQQTQQPQQQPTQAKDPRVDNLQEKIDNLENLLEQNQVQNYRRQWAREEKNLRDKFKGKVGDDQLNDMINKAKLAMKKNKIPSLTTAFKTVAFDDLVKQGVGEGQGQGEGTPAGGSQQPTPPEASGQGQSLPDDVDPTNLSEDERDQMALQDIKNMMGEG